MNDFLSELIFIFQRLDWLGVLDISLVTLIFFGLLYLVRDTQATLLLRGVIFIAVFIALFANLVELPAFSWLLKTVLPAIIFAIPVIFAPEIRRALERIGRAGTFVHVSNRATARDMQKIVQVIATAAGRLAASQHGALIVLERSDPLDEYLHTGVPLNATVTPELLIQIFYPNTPLHDGAVIISENRVAAAACVMPLSSSGILARTPERKMGLRHRAALGISEVTDAIAIVISEETGSISIAHAGRMIRRLDAQRLENILLAFYQPEKITPANFFQRHFPHLFSGKEG